MFGIRMDSDSVVCPTCFETFTVVLPSSEEVPCELDYDCEICCRPMIIHCEEDRASGQIIAYAVGLEDC